MSAASGSLDFRAMSQELRSNPKTQAALVAFALVLVYALYTFLAPDTPKGHRAVTAKAGANLDPRQLQGLHRLPDLAALGKAGELPPPAKVQRDLFMFEAPPPPAPVKVVAPPPPPPPPTPEEVEKQRLAAEKAGEYQGRPMNLRYLGFFKGRPSGIVAAFMKDEEPLTLAQGTVYLRWKLVTVTDTKAEFQNTKYSDLRMTLETREGSSPAAPTNQF
jgi:hypothetical protein